MKPDASPPVERGHTIHEMDETAHLFRSPANAARLASSMENARQGRYLVKTLEDIDNACEQKC